MLTKSSTELVRQQNSSLVLSALRRGGPLAHTDLSALTGLSSATVSAITADLERVGILERLEQKPAAGRGRPRVLFSQRRDGGYIVVVRISSDTVQYSLADYGGTLMDRFEEARGSQGAALGGGAGDTRAFAAGFMAALNRLVQRSRLDRRQIVAVSISSKASWTGRPPVSSGRPSSARRRWISPRCFPPMGGMRRWCSATRRCWWRRR